MPLETISSQLLPTTNPNQQHSMVPQLPITNPFTRTEKLYTELNPSTKDTSLQPTTPQSKSETLPISLMPQTKKSQDQLQPPKSPSGENKSDKLTDSRSMKPLPLTHPLSPLTPNQSPQITNPTKLTPNLPKSQSYHHSPSGKNLESNSKSTSQNKLKEKKSLLAQPQSPALYLLQLMKRERPKRKASAVHHGSGTC